MAVTQNTYTGNGSTTNYPFTFPYLETTDIKVSLNGTVTTTYTLANATTIQFNTAPANGAAIRIYRQTDDAELAAQFYPGSAIRSQDLNDNFTQNLYVTQESSNNAATATSTANTALTNSNTAISTANTALSTANTASTNASAAVGTANTASTNASAAVSTANTAAANATTAINTANAATTTANNASASAATANTTANSAVSTANAASSAATNAVNTANAASAAASSAVTTANTASANATTAVNTANSATTTANSATTTANTANSKADQAIAAVSNSINFQLKANVAAIPATPANDTYIEVQNSTGLESFTPLAGMPAGFVGDSGLSVRLRYTTAGSTWNWLNYYANNSETRYLKLTGGTLTGNITLAGAPSSSLHPATKAYVDGYVSAINGDIASLGSTKLDSSTAASTYLSQANAASTYLTQANAASTYQTQAGMSSYLTTSAAGTTYAPLASPTFTGTVTIPAGASISGYLATSAIGTTVQSYDADTAKTDVAQTFTAAQRGAYVTLTDAATIATDLSLGNQFQVTLGGNRTLGAPTNVVAGQSGVIRVVQDSSGSRSLAYNSVFKFPGGTAPTLTTAANSVDLLAYHVESTTRIAVRFIGDVK